MNLLDITLVFFFGQLYGNSVYILGQKYERRNLIKRDTFERNFMGSSGATPDEKWENAHSTQSPLIPISQKYNVPNEDNIQKLNSREATDSIRPRHFFHTFKHHHNVEVFDRPPVNFISPNQQFTHSHRELGQFPTNSHTTFSSQHFLPISTKTIPTVNADRVTINQNFQISQIDGNENAVSQNQESKGNFVFDKNNQNFQISHIGGNQNAVSQNQESKGNFVFDQNNRNFQISHIGGNQNAVSQNQASKGNFFIDGNNGNFQSSQIFGNNNAVTQTRSSDQHLGVPYLIHVEREKQNWPDCLRNRNKRSIISRDLFKRSVFSLITNRNSKLDVPQTFRNAERAFKSTTENRRAPVFHLGKAVDSTKNALISTLNIIPSDIGTSRKEKTISESSGKIFNRGNRKHFSYSAKRRSEDNDVPFESVYRKFGSMLRESADSGRATLNHLSDAYDSAKEVLYSSGNLVPSVIVRSFRIPAVKRRFRRNLQRMYAETPNRHDAEQTVRFLDDLKRAVGVDCMKDFMVKIKRQIINPPIERNRETSFWSGSSLNDDEARSLDTQKTMDVLRSLNGQSESSRTNLKMSDDFKTEREEFLNKNNSVSQKGLVLDQRLLQPFMDERLTSVKNYNLRESNDSTLDEEKKSSTMDPSEKRMSMTMGEHLITPYMGKIENMKRVDPNQYYNQDYNY